MRRVPRSRPPRSLICIRDRKTFASSEGELHEQEITETGWGIEATAVGEGEVQKRSYPNCGGRHTGTAGWELVERIDLPAHGERPAKRALLTARQCPPGVRTVILDGSQVALQVHESCGHPIELDRVFGPEASLRRDRLPDHGEAGTFRYGSEAVTIVADATVPGGWAPSAATTRASPAAVIWSTRGASRAT